MSIRLVRNLRLDESIDTSGSQINNVSFLKPVHEKIMNLSALLYSSPEMSSPISNTSFDSSRADCSAYIEAFDDNNDNNTPNNNMGTQWIKPVGGGFGPEYNNAPVVVHIREWMNTKSEFSDFIKNFTDSSRLYLRYVWYYADDDNNKHSSDMYSQVIPANSEQTAFRDVASSSQLIASAVRLAAQNQHEAVHHAEFIDGKFIALPNTLNVMEEPLCMDSTDEDRNTIMLSNYSQGYAYDLKFYVIGQEEIEADFIDDNGMPLDSIDTSSIMFIPQHMYVVRVYAGFAQTLHEQAMQ